jgi:hypothetical protein
MRLVVQAWAAARAADVGVVIGHLPGWAEARGAGPAACRWRQVVVPPDSTSQLSSVQLYLMQDEST